MSPERMKRMLVLFAMEAEAAPLASRLGCGGFPEWIGPHLAGRAARVTFGAREILIAHTGKDDRYGVDNVSPVPAAVTAFSLIARNRPDLVISAGTAGGFADRGARIGDVYVSRERIVFHDRRIPLEGYREYGTGGYPCVDIGPIARELGMKEGLVSTGSSLDAAPEDLARMNASGADVKDMEAAAVVWVAGRYGKPMLAVKAITDLVDTPASTPDEFTRNFDLAVNNLADKLCRLLKRI